MSGNKKNLWKWCAKVCRGYAYVDIHNLHTSWGDGWAMVALVHSLIDKNFSTSDNYDYDSLVSEDDPSKAVQLAFELAERVLGVPSYLDVEDLLCDRPDDMILYTYLVEFYKRYDQTKLPAQADSPLARTDDVDGDDPAMGIQSEIAGILNVARSGNDKLSRRLAAMEASQLQKQIAAHDAEQLQQRNQRQALPSPPSPPRTVLPPPPPAVESYDPHAVTYDDDDHDTEPTWRKSLQTLVQADESLRVDYGDDSEGDDDEDDVFRIGEEEEEEDDDDYEEEMEMDGEAEFRKVVLFDKRETEGEEEEEEEESIFDGIEQHDEENEESESKALPIPMIIINEEEEKEESNISSDVPLPLPPPHPLPKQRPNSVTLPPSSSSSSHPDNDDVPLPLPPKKRSSARLPSLHIPAPSIIVPPPTMGPPAPTLPVPVPTLPIDEYHFNPDIEVEDVSPSMTMDPPPFSEVPLVEDSAGAAIAAHLPPPPTLKKVNVPPPPPPPPPTVSALPPPPPVVGVSDSTNTTTSGGGLPPPPPVAAVYRASFNEGDDEEEVEKPDHHATGTGTSTTSHSREEDYHEMQKEKIGSIVSWVVHAIVLAGFGITWIFGLTRVFDGRGTFQSSRFGLSVQYWLFTFALLSLPILFALLSLVYCPFLKRCSQCYTFTYLYRGLILLVFGAMILTTEWYDVVFGIVVMILGILVLVLEVLSWFGLYFAPRPKRSVLYCLSNLECCQRDDDDEGGKDDFESDYPGVAVEGGDGDEEYY